MRNPAPALLAGLVVSCAAAPGRGVDDEAWPVEEGSLLWQALDVYVQEHYRRDREAYSDRHPLKVVVGIDEGRRIRLVDAPRRLVSSWREAGIPIDATYRYDPSLRVAPPCRLEVTFSEVEDGHRVWVLGIPTNSAGIVPGFETCLLVLVGDRLTVERWQVEGMCDL